MLMLHGIAGLGSSLGLSAVMGLSMVAGLPLSAPLGTLAQPETEPETAPATAPATGPATAPGDNPPGQECGVDASHAPTPENLAKGAVGDGVPLAKLLDDLERANAGLKTLTADIKYDRLFEIAGDRQTRIGSLVYFDAGQKDAANGTGDGERNAKRDRRFSVTFDRLQVGRRIEPQELTYIFDGTFLVERSGAEKQVVKRRVVAEGDARDPMRIGEGPIPLPIGQKREDILARFDASVVPAEEGFDFAEDDEAAALRQFVDGTRQLKLIPKPGNRDLDDVVEVRLWYRDATDESGTPTLLPRLAKTVNRVGDVALVQLVNVKLNPEIDRSRLRTDEVPAGWSLIEQDLTKK